MSCSVEFEKFNKASGKNEKFFKLDEAKQDLLDKQINSTHTALQKEIADKLIRHHSTIVGVNKDNYINAMGKPFKRVTRFMKELRGGYYSFDSENYDEEEYNINIEWGNVIDEVFEGVILGKSDSEIFSDLTKSAYKVSINTNSINIIRKQVETLKKLHPNALMLPQLTLSSSIGVAGTPDLLLVEPNGAKHIYDLKSSINPITKERERVDKFGNTFTTFYEKTFKGKASKKQTHEAQLSFYKGFVKEVLGEEVETLGVIPVQLSVDQESNVTDLSFEDLYQHQEDKAIVENMEKLSSREEFISNLTDLANTEFMGAVVEALERELKNLRKQKKFTSIPKIQNIIDNIQIGKGMSRISEFIEYIHDEFVSGNNSLLERFNALDLDVKEGNYENLLGEIDKFKSEVELFRGIIEELYNITESSKDMDSIDKDSLIGKLNDITLTFSRIERNTNNKVIPLIAKILSKQLPQGKEYKEALTNRIESIKKRLQKKYITKKRRETLLDDLKNTQDRLNESDATIEEALRTGNYKDISVLSANLNPAVSVDNSIIATFAKTLKEKFELARVKLFGLEKAAAKAFDEYSKHTNVHRNNVAKFNEPFYEIINSGKKPYYALVQKLDYNAYREAMAKVREEAGKTAKYLQSIGQYSNYSFNSLKEKIAREEALKLGYLKKRGQHDTKVKNPYTGETVVLEKGWASIAADKRKSLSKDRYNAWINNNFTFNKAGTEVTGVVGTELLLPNDEKFQSAKYKELGSENSPKMKYYKFLLATYRQAQTLIKDERMMNKIPGVEKIANDRVREGDIKGWFNRTIEGTLGYLPNEQEEYGGQLEKEDRKKKENEELKKRIPHFYSEDLGLENTSLDLIGSILRYSAAAHRYEAQSNLEPVAKSLLDVVKKKGPLHDSNTPLSKVFIKHKALGEYFRKHEGNNTAAMLEALIDTHIYGQTRLKSEGRVNWNKIVDGLMGFASFTQIGGNPVLGVANSLAAHISTNIDAMANEHFKTKTWLWAKAEYRKNEGNFITDMVGTTKRSKIGQLTQLYDALQGEYFDEFGRKMSQGKIKKMWGSKGWFSLMHKGEHAAQTKVMMSVLKDTMIKDKNGKEISLYDAYTVDSQGNLVLNAPGELLNLQAMNKIHSLNKRFNGVYNGFDKPLIKRHNMGRLIMMYRDFIVPSFRRRFKSWGVDYESGSEYEGYYNTFFRVLAQERGEMLNMLMRNDHNLTSHEVANVKRMATEITYMMLLSSLIGLIGAALDDGDDDDAIGVQMGMKYAMYWSMRSMSELSFYNLGLGSVNTFLLPLNPGGTLRSFRTPSPSYSILEKSFRAIRHTGALIGGSDEAYYKRDMNYNTIFGNLAEKGDSKALVSWMKLAGLNGNIMNIDNAIKILDIYD